MFLRQTAEGDEGLLEHHRADDDRLEGAAPGCRDGRLFELPGSEGIRRFGVALEHVGVDLPSEPAQRRQGSG